MPFLNKKIFLLVLLVLLIFLVAIAILLIDLKSKKEVENPAFSSNKELNVLITKLDQISTTEDKANREYEVAESLLRKAAVGKTTEERYVDFKAGIIKVQQIYSTNHNSDLYRFLNKEIVAFAKEEFANNYEENVFNYPCQDPNCTNSEQPKEILEIIEDIESSDMPQLYKDSFSNNLLNTGYESDDANSRAWQYLLTARSLEVSSDLSKSGANLAIAKKIRDFLASSYPKEYELLRSAEAGLVTNE